MIQSILDAMGRSLSGVKNIFFKRLQKQYLSFQENNPQYKDLLRITEHQHNNLGIT